MTAPPISTSSPVAVRRPATGQERRQAETQAGLDAKKSEPEQLDALHTEHGDTTIADGVAARIAGIAAREVSGVHAMGNAARRAIGDLALRIPGSAQPSVSGTTALFVGLILGLTAAFATFGSFMTVRVLGAVGLVTGLALDGLLNVAGPVGRANEKR